MDGFEDSEDEGRMGRSLRKFLSAGMSKISTNRGFQRINSVRVRSAMVLLPPWRAAWGLHIKILFPPFALLGTYSLA